MLHILSTTAPLMVRGAWCECLLLKSTTICLIFLHGKEGIVVSAPLNQLVHYLPLVAFLIVSDGAHHCGVICKLDVVGAMFVLNAELYSKNSIRAYEYNQYKSVNQN